MLKIRTVAIIGFISLSVFWFIGTAVSQTNSTTNASGGIAITPIVVALINLAFPAVGAVATYLIHAHVKNQEMATQLTNAVNNAIGTVQQNAAESLQGKTQLKLTQDDPAIQKGVQYVVNNAAEAIKHFKIPTDRIAQKLEAKVGLKAIETNLAATASPVPGVTSPLAPVPAVHSEA